MTPETARALELGTTPGPWKARHGSDNTSYVQEEEWFSAIGSAEFGHAEAEYSPADANLIAAAPDMRATIAAQTWEYRAQYREVWGAWLDVTRWTNEEEARLSLTPYQMKNATTRLVRRPVGPVEVVEE